MASKKKGKKKAPMGAVQRTVTALRTYIANKTTSANLKLLGGYMIVALVAGMPVLNFWTMKNIDEIAPSDMIRTFIIISILSLLIYLAWLAAFKRIYHKAVILSSWTVIVFINYAYIFALYQNLVKFGLQLKQETESHYLLILLLMFLTFKLYIWIKKSTSIKPLFNYLAMLSLVLLIFNLFPLLRFLYLDTRYADVRFDAQEGSQQSSEGPSIYYIVPDRYASNVTLKEVYNFDNSDFTESLESKGFYVAKNSIANYPNTSFSLPSSLNLNYYTEEHLKHGKIALSKVKLAEYIEDNVVIDTLKKRDYQIVNIGSRWDPSKYNKNADQDLIKTTGIVLLGKEIDLKENERIILENSIFWQLFQSRISLKNRRIFSLTFPDRSWPTKHIIHQQTINHQLKTIEAVSQQKGKKFIFMHILFPHDPYVFNESCRDLNGRYKGEHMAYIKQLKCANQKLLATLSAIQKNDKNAVILLQADEGPYTLEYRKNRNLNWKNEPTKKLEEKSRILNAYYFPDKDYSKLYQHITPVNSFRIVFDKYLGTNYGFLDDKNYSRESDGNYFNLFEFTDRVRRQ